MIENKNVYKNAIRKKVCMIRSNSVNPDSRVEKEAATLQKNGYEVVILAWDRESNHSVKKEKIEVYGQIIDIFRIGCKATYGEGMKNILPYLRFQFIQLIWLIKNKKNIDIIHACDFDTAFFSRLANIFIHKKFVFDIFDFLYGSPKTLVQWLVKKIQIDIINNSSLTIICTEDRRRQIKDANPKNIVVIHNTPIQLTSSLTCDRKNYDNKKVKVVYVGILQDYRLLLEITDFFKNNSNFELHIGGFGKYENFFRELSKEYQNIFFYGKLPYDKTLELEQHADIMLALYDPSIENHRFAAPNKFYESLMLGKPVIMVKGTGMSEYVEKYKLGQVIEYSLESFAKGIDSLLTNRVEWEQMSARMRDIYKKEFSWSVMEHRLINMYIKL